MRRALAVFVALLAGAAEAQYVTTDGVAYPPVPAYWGLDWAVPTGGAEQPVLVLPLLTNGAAFAETAQTVSHLTWDGSALRESVGGVSWSMNGTVPQVAGSSSAFSPGKAGAGPYSAANSYSGPTTVGEWTGDWSVTVVWSQTAFPATHNEVLVAKLNSAANAGWAMLVNASTGNLRLFYYDGAAKQPTATGTILNGINVATVGKSGVNCYSRLNGGTAVAVACGTMTAASAEPIRIGRYAGATDFSEFTTIYEVIASTEPYSDALHLSRWRRAVGLEVNGTTVSLTRATTRTCEVNGVTWNVANDAPCINASGMLVERATTNRILQSNVLTNASWVKRGTGAVTTDGTICPNGETAGLVTVGASGVNDVYQAIAAGFTGTEALGTSYWIKRSSASGTFTIINAQGPTFGTDSIDLAAIGTGWTYVTGTRTGVTRSTAWTANAGAGGMLFYAASGPLAAYVCQTQQESGTPTSYQPTAGTTVARNADVATVPTPSGLDPARWCVSVDATPYGGRAWTSASTTTLFSTYPGTTPNTVNLQSSSATQIAFKTFQGSGAVKTATWTHGLSAGSVHKIAASNNAGTMTIRSDGADVGATISGAGTGVLGAWLTPIQLGSEAGAGQFDGYLSNFKIYRSPSCGR